MSRVITFLNLFSFFFYILAVNYPSINNHVLNFLANNPLAYQKRSPLVHIEKQIDTARDFVQ